MDLSVTVDVSLKFHFHAHDIYDKTSDVVQPILRGTVCHSHDFMMKVFITHVRPTLYFASVV